MCLNTYASISEKEKIVKLRGNGMKCSEIAQIFNVGASTVRRIILKHKRGISLARKSGSGGRRATTLRQDHVIMNLAKKSGGIAMRGLQTAVSDCGIQISRMTLSRRLKEMGLRPIKPIHKPKLQRQHIRHRKLFCQQYESWTFSDWGKVIWSDETSIFLNPEISSKKIWLPREKPAPVHEVQRFSKKITLWACMNSSGIVAYDIVEVNVNARVYIDIMDRSLLPLRRLFEENQGFIFQQDNAPAHTAKKVRKFHL